MKTTLFVAALLLSAATATGKDIKTAVFTTQPQMHCESCENKIKNNLRFEKGIKKIETDVPNQAVTITYDADKTNVSAIAEGFKKIGYEATTKTKCAGKTCCGKNEACNGKQTACPDGQSTAATAGDCCETK